MARVFSAIDIEDHELLEELSRVRDRLDLGFSTVPAEKMHVTLEFFEDIDSSEIQQVKKAMESAGLESFESEVSGVGCFPSKDYIRVVWAGIKNGSFSRLYRRVSDHGVESSNDHNFNPHVTLMRVRNISPERKKKLQKTLEEFKNHRFGDLKVRSVKLFRSEMTPEGSRYSLIEEVEL